MAAEAPAPPKVVLVIAQDAIFCAGLQAILEREGYATQMAADGRDGIAMLRAGLAPALILLEMILPQFDGWWFCRQKRQQDPSIAAIPTVLMTRLQIASDEWARSLGAVALLRKPFEVDDLLQAVRRHG